LITAGVGTIPKRNYSHSANIPLAGQGDGAELGSRSQDTPPQLKQAIGPDVLAALGQQTGLTKEELSKGT
jgi:hypothetical protein